MEPLKIDWTQFKTIATLRNLSIQYVDYNQHYTVFAFDAAFALLTRIYQDGNPDQVDFETNYQPTANQLIYNRNILYNPSNDAELIINADGSINCKVTVNGAQAIEVRWRTPSGTATAHQRTLNILRLA